MNSKSVAIILGGGRGSRLYPLTDKRCKPAVPIAGKYRLIDIPISNCLNSGIRNMFVLTQFNSASLNRHIKNTYHFDVFGTGFVDILAAEQTDISTDWFQGTADAVRQSLPRMTGIDYDYILILSGDQLYQMDLNQAIEYHKSNNAGLTIATIPVNAEDASGFGIMKVDGYGHISDFIEKPSSEEVVHWKSEVNTAQKESGRTYLASMGIYIFNKETLNHLLDDQPEAIDFGKDIIPSAVRGKTQVYSFAYDGYWTDIGTIKSFFDANISLTENLPEFHLFDNYKKIYSRARMLSPSKIFGTKFNQVLLSEGCIIHAKEISHSVIGIRARIGQNTTMNKVIVMGNDYYQSLSELCSLEESKLLGIGRDCFIENAIIDKNAKIGNGVIIKGDRQLEDSENGKYCVRQGIIIVKKGAYLPEGTVIQK